MPAHWLKRFCHKAADDIDCQAIKLASPLRWSQTMPKTKVAASRPGTMTQFGFIVVYASTPVLPGYFTDSGWAFPVAFFLDSSTNAYNAKWLK